MFVRYQHAKKIFLAVAGFFVFSCTCGMCTLGQWSGEESEVVSSRGGEPKRLAAKPKAVPRVAPKKDPLTGLKKNLPPRVTPKAGAKQDDLVLVRETMLTKRASGKKQKDLFRGRGPKVNLYDDDKNGSWDRAKVDLDRDENWDEKWTVKRGDVERKVISSNEVLLWKDGAWVPKKK